MASAMKLALVNINPHVLLYECLLCIYKSIGGQGKERGFLYSCRFALIKRA